jgi:hypothetical protein
MGVDRRLATCDHLAVLSGIKGRYEGVGRHVDDKVVVDGSRWNDASIECAWRRRWVVVEAVKELEENPALLHGLIYLWQRELPQRPFQNSRAARKKRTMRLAREYIPEWPSSHISRIAVKSGKYSHHCAQ